MYYVCETYKLLENVVKRSEFGYTSTIQKLSIIIINSELIDGNRHMQ